MRRVKYIGTFCLLFTVTEATAQVVEITTVGQRPIESAERISSNPKIIDTVFPVPNANYPLLSISYDPYFTLNPIVPATVNLNQKLPQLYHGYARVGIGSVFMPLAEIYYNSTRTRKLNWGVHARHLSSMGPIRDYAPANFDRTNAKAFIGVNEKHYSYGGDMFYSNNGFHYYGFNNPNANADSIAQRFSTFAMKGNFVYHRHDSLGVNWKAGMEYRHFNNQKPDVDSLKEWHMAEDYVHLNGGAWMKWEDEIFEADASLKINKYQYGEEFQKLTTLDSGLVTNNTVFSLKPHITTYSKNTKLKAKIGVDITVSSVDKAKFILYPDAELKYSLFDNILIPYVQVRGGMKQQTYYSFAQENEFIRSQIPFRNENTRILGLIGMKGTLSKRVGFNIQASFANVKDKALFVTDTTYSDGNKFGIIYDTMNVASVEGSLTYQLLEKTKIDLIGRYNSYSALNNSYAWYLPQVEGILRGTYNLYDKFIFNADITLQGGRKALVYEDGEDVTIENNQYVKTLGFVADANLGLEYRYNKRISAFVNFNNVAAQRYRRWYNYPVQGFQAMAGVTVRF